jgi:hypothetical protein
MVSPTGAPSISLMPAIRKPTSPGPSAWALGLLRREDADAVGLVHAPVDMTLILSRLRRVPLLDADQRDDADVGVEPGIDDQRLQRRLRIALRAAAPGDQHLEQVRDALAGLGADAQRILGIEADDLLDLVDAPLRLGRRQVDLVQDRQHLEPEVDGRVAVGDALRLDALAASTTSSAPSQAASERETS